MKIILASSSQRRKDLMSQAKIPYEVMESSFDEKVDSKLSLEEQSKEIAYGKAKEIFEKTTGNRAVIGSDTLVIIDGKKFGKAKSREEAIQMLQTIQGKSHWIYTSLAILIEEDGELKTYKELSKSQVFVKKMTKQEVEHYVDTEQPYFCAGAYAIQGVFAVFIERIEGDYSAILGLPIGRVYEILKLEKILENT